MKLYIKQKVFSLGDRFTVKDANGDDRYFVEGPAFSVGKKLRIYDEGHCERAYIAQKLLSWMPTYDVFRNGEQFAQVKRDFTFFRPKYTIHGPDWEVQGDFFAHEYQVTHCGRPIATISKEWMTWGDSYELDIADGVDVVTALAVVLAIDAVIESSQNNN